MMKIVLLVVMLLLTPISNASATLFWDWKVLNNNITVGPTDTVTILGQLTNLPTSDRNYIESDFSGMGVFDIDLRPYYNGMFSLPNEPNQFAGLNLAPGESFFFHHYILEPRTDNPIITNKTFSFNINVTADQTRTDVIPALYLDQQYTLSVQAETVPEPATIMLFGTSLIGMFLHRRKNPL